MPAAWALVPIKLFATAKTRLEGLLTRAECARLAEEMARDVLRALKAAPDISGIAILSNEPRLAALAETAGATLYAEQGGEDYRAALRRVAAEPAAAPAGIAYATGMLLHVRRRAALGMLTYLFWEREPPELATARAACRDLAVPITIGTTILSREHSADLDRVELGGGLDGFVALCDPDAPFAVGHVQISEGAGVMIVMPATANIVGKAASGIADDAVSASIMAAACPVVFVPNMNDRMWRRPAVQRNIRTLNRDGYHIVPPVAGPAVSTGRTATGGMPDFETILAAVRRRLRASRRRS